METPSPETPAGDVADVAVDGQRVGLPEPHEMVTVVDATAFVVPRPNGLAFLSFQTPLGRRYTFVLDRQGRNVIGKDLLAPSVHVPGAGDLRAGA